MVVFEDQKFFILTWSILSILFCHFAYCALFIKYFAILNSQRHIPAFSCKRFNILIFTFKFLIHPKCICIYSVNCRRNFIRITDYPNTTYWLTYYFCADFQRQFSDTRFLNMYELVSGFCPVPLPICLSLHRYPNKDGHFL